MSIEEYRRTIVDTLHLLRERLRRLRKVAEAVRKYADAPGYTLPDELRRALDALDETRGEQP